MWSVPRVPRLYAAALGTLLGLALLAAGEGYCRLFTRINFLDSSPNLFVPDRFGSSRGNLVSGEGTSFGHSVHTDENGFRVEPAFPEPRSGRAVLFLGDSVGFACGVDEADSALGLLRRARRDWRVYNASVVGYSVRDYKNVLEAFVPAHPEVRAVYVLMCLNDIHDLSAVEIETRLGGRPAVGPPGAEAPRRLRLAAERLAVLQAANEWLRSRSKLYLFLRTVSSDASLRFFLDDLQMYRAGDGTFEAGMAHLAAMSDRLRAADIPFRVIVLPYEAQLRGENEEYLVPQRRIMAYLRERRIAGVDATPAFRNAGSPPGELYLFGDPMHLSPRGHGVLFEILRRDLDALPAAASVD